MKDEELDNKLDEIVELVTRVCLESDGTVSEYINRDLLRSEIKIIINKKDKIKDAEKLIDIWKQLNQIGSDLIDIEKRHPKVKDIHLVIGQAIDKLSETGHMLFSEAYEIKKDEENKE